MIHLKIIHIFLIHVSFKGIWLIISLKKFYIKKRTRFSYYPFFSPCIPLFNELLRMSFIFYFLTLCIIFSLDYKSKERQVEKNKREEDPNPCFYSIKNILKSPLHKKKICPN